jgi:hypothetical protein
MMRVIGGEMSKEFDYSWDDQDPDQIADLALGHDGVQSDEDFISYGSPSDCGCAMGGDGEICGSCGHNPMCSSADIHEHFQDLGDEEEDEDEEVRDEISETLLPNNDAIHDSSPKKVLLSDSLVAAIAKIRQVKAMISELEMQEQELRATLLEAVGNTPSLLVDSRDTNKVLAAVKAAPFTHMKSGAMKKLERNHPELFMEYCERREIVKLLLQAG